MKNKTIIKLHVEEYDGGWSRSHKSFMVEANVPAEDIKDIQQLLNAVLEALDEQAKMENSQLPQG